MSQPIPTLNDKSFSGEIRVASRIIDYLSSGLYHTPAACLKELVNNSYDAGATRVDIFVKPDADRIIIEDNGSGLTKEEFTTHFNRISESHKRDGSDQTLYGRSKIGKIGIGFIAANELCEVLEIFSTKRDSCELLHVIIDFQEMRKPIEDRRRGQDDIVKADYEGEILEANYDEHYTQLFLTSVRGPAREILAGASSQSSRDTTLSLYGLKRESVAYLLENTTVNSWKDFDPYSETMLEVGLNVPIKYYENWIPIKLQEDVIDFEKEVNSLNFDVFYDGSEMRRPIVFSPPDDFVLLSRFEFSGKFVSAKGYFYSQHGTVKPNNLQGLLVRIRQAAVGEYDHTFWGFSQSDNPLIQRWISAEIWADDRLEEAMNIDRRTLRIAHPSYVELREAIHKQLGSVLYQTRRKIYEVGNTERKEKRSEDAARSISSLASLVVAPIAPVAARQLEQSVIDAPKRPKIQKALQRKFSMTELYETIIDVAKDIVTPEQLKKLLERLTERLGA